MGLFNRKRATDEKPVEERSTTQTITFTQEDTSGYSLPMSLGFESSLKKNVNILNLSAAFSAAEIISNKIASIPIVVKTTNDEEIRHSFDKVFDNTISNKFITIKQLIWDCLIYGNGFAYIERRRDGSVEKLTYMAPGTVSIIYNQQSRELYYLAPTITKSKIEPINMIHIFKNSVDGVNGKPISWYARKAILLAASAENAALNFFDSGCAVSGILKSNKQLSTQQKMDIKQSWNQAHLPGETSGLAVLGSDLDYVETGANSAESQLLESRKYSVREIARFFGILPELLGDEVNRAYNSVTESLKALVSFTLEPLIMILECEFNKKCLLPSEKYELYIDFKEEELYESDSTAQAQQLNSLVAGGIMTPNEARKILGLPTVEDGDNLREPKQDNTNDTIGKTDITK